MRRRRPLRWGSAEAVLWSGDALGSGALLRFAPLRPRHCRLHHRAPPHPGLCAAGDCHFRNKPAGLSCIPPGTREIRVPYPGTADAVAAVINGTATGPNASRTCILHPALAPCTIEALHAPDVCPVTRDEVSAWFYGGAGIILSRGLMEAIHESQWKETEARAAGGATAGDAAVWVRAVCRFTRCYVHLHRSAVESLVGRRCPPISHG